ncbi:hypothetical protein SAMN02745136_01066 [Anaerocolumna jejuensis DSM 15929]|uniref:Uncharacterized protein n=1 Tax=Anaerocolumna jejuensis DSM 15929 TaxID=1121322 RepID=A0A1M6MLT5_9FIRM|nr:hypothetical protein [Anaerocolumna jejuensis]SHJ84243.1 hypothetical protein SAMN02745136_01066 [Anaerocolumna jejuensis DSM 15929]
MKYQEYESILKEALLEYLQNGGSLVEAALKDMPKEYIYEFDEKYPEDIKKQLIDKAHRAMRVKKDLPDGIRLVKVVIKK